MDGLLLKNKDDGGEDVIQDVGRDEGGVQVCVGGWRFWLSGWVEWRLWSGGDHGRERYSFFENLSRSFFWPLMELQKWDPNTRPLSLVAVNRSWP